MPVDPDDEFFGDQSSDSGNADEERSSGSGKGNQGQGDTLSNHEYRSREAAVKKLSYLDGYDETKEEKLQEGFSDGYRQSFNDALSIGRRLGSLCAGVALEESSTLGKSNKADDAQTNIIERPASFVRQFLTEQILAGSGNNEESEKKYAEALLGLRDQLEKMGT